jgi:MFS family permease
MSELSAPSQPKTNNNVLLVFLMLLNIMNFVDRQLLASFANDIKPELGLTDTEFGWLTGLVFIFFYAFMGLIAGAIADRVHRPRLIAAGVALWSILTMASGAARGFMTLAIPRLFIGIGESVLTPSSMSLLADRFPSKQLGFVSGFYYLGVPIGVGFSMLIAGYLGPEIGWRNCFYLLGGLGVVMALGMLLVTEKPDHGKQPASSEVDKFSSSLVREVFSILRNSPPLFLTITGGVFLHFILGAAAYDQLWYVQERGFDKSEVLVISGWIGTFAGIAGSLFGGLASDYWQKRTGTSRPMFLFWVMLLMMPIYFSYRVVDPSSMMFWTGLGAGFFMLGSFYGPTFSTVQELSPTNRRATITAFYILMLNLVGLGIGATGAGIAVDWLRTAGYAEPYTIVLIVFTLLSSLSIPFFFFAGRMLNKDRRA